MDDGYGADANSIELAYRNWTRQVTYLYMFGSFITILLPSHRSSHDFKIISINICILFRVFKYAYYDIIINNIEMPVLV